jgi:hypothetical protein
MFSIFLISLSLAFIGIRSKQNVSKDVDLSPVLQFDAVTLYGLILIRHLFFQFTSASIQINKENANTPEIDKKIQ